MSAQVLKIKNSQNGQSGLNGKHARMYWEGALTKMQQTLGRKQKILKSLHIYNT